MRTLAFFAFAMFMVFSLRAADSEETKEGPTVTTLLRNIRSVLPAGWIASYSKEESWLEISRDEEVWTLNEGPNLPPLQKPELRKFTFAFRILPFVTASEYDRWKVENAGIYQKMNAFSEEWSGARSKGDFSPKTEIEKTKVAEYRALEGELHHLPDYYFKNVSLLWGFGGPKQEPFLSVTDDHIQKECDLVKEKVTQLFSKYDSAGDQVK